MRRNAILSKVLRPYVPALESDDLGGPSRKLLVSSMRLEMGAVKTVLTELVISLNLSLCIF